jgi:hypothetical protein
MDALTPKEFLEKLNASNLKPGLALTGIVKKSENASELQFAPRPNYTDWITIPSSLLESVKVLRNIHVGDSSYPLVKLYLKTPSDSQAQVIYDLLAALLPVKLYKPWFVRQAGALHGHPCHCGKHQHCSCGCSGQHCHCGWPGHHHCRSGCYGHHPCDQSASGNNMQ